MKPSAVRRLLIAALLAAASRPLSAQTDSTGRAEVRTVASATRSVRPDVAYFTITVSVADSSPRAALRALASQVATVRGALQRIGTTRDSLLSRNSWGWWPERMAVVPGFHVLENPRRTVQDTTYRAADVIEVRLHDFTKISPMLDTVVALGIRQISAVRYQATDLAAAQDAALREATERARREAAAIAEASGGRLGRIIVLAGEPDANAVNANRLSGVVPTVVSFDPAYEVVAPSVTVGVTVHGSWELLRDR